MRCSQEVCERCSDLAKRVWILFEFPRVVLITFSGYWADFSIFPGELRRHSDLPSVLPGLFQSVVTFQETIKSSQEFWEEHKLILGVF